MSAYRRPWYLGPDPKDFTCPTCRAPIGDACTPMKNTGYPTILRPHKKRGMFPFQIAAMDKAKGRQ